MKRSLRSWLWRVSVHQEVNEELQFHIESRVTDLQSRGLPLEEARRQARREFGNPVAIEDRSCTRVSRPA